MPKYLYSFLLLALLSVFYIQCSQYVVDGGDKSNRPDSGNKRGSDSSINPINSRGTDDSSWDDSAGGGRRCIYRVDDCLPDRDDHDPDAPSVKEKYKQLEDRYGKGNARLDVNPNRVEEYNFGREPNYEVTKGKIYVDLSRVSGKRHYRGDVVVALEQQLSDGEYTAPHAKFSSGGDDDSRYNIWGNFNKRLGFHGFFSDNRSGSIILVLGEGTDPLKNTDGNRKAIRFSSGSVWFMNFRSLRGNNYKDCYEGGQYIGLTGHIPKPPKKCWFIGAGPFDCRGLAGWKKSGCFKGSSAHELLLSKIS